MTEEMLQPDRKLVIISFTKIGTELSQKLCKSFKKRNCEGYAPERFAGEMNKMPEDLKGWISSQWGKADFLFVGAVGIAVRMIAPCLQDKYTDSAVLSVDEKGQYVIPILSGHVGGGVELASKIAEFTGGIPVITTATDVQGKFAVDVFAKDHGLAITDRQLAKCISAAVLEGKKVGFFAEQDCKNWITDMDAVLQRFGELQLCESESDLEQYEYGILVSQRTDKGKEKVLRLLPRNIVAGVGCRKGTPLSALETGMTEILAEHHLVWEQLGVVVSIDLKAKEQGLLEMCRGRGIPFLTYSAEELRKVGAVSSGSEFVKQITGVDNVCERAVKYYLKEHDNGKIIQEKRCLEGMTVAIGQWTWDRM